MLPHQHRRTSPGRELHPRARRYRALAIHAACLIAALILTVPASFGARTSKYTAHYVQANIGKLDGKRHSVQVVGVRPDRIEGEIQWFHAFTWDNTDRGSWINVAVRAGEADLFLRKFGTYIPTWITPEIKNRRLDAVVRIDSGGEAFLDYEGATKGAIRSATVARTDNPFETLIRTWTAADGRTLEAEYLWHTRTSVTIRREADGRTFTLARDDITQADNDWLDARD